MLLPVWTFGIGRLREELQAVGMHIRPVLAAPLPYRLHKHRSNRLRRRRSNYLQHL
jgi:hypothetical protein